MFNTETLTTTIAASNVRQLRDICKEYTELFDGYSPVVKKGKKALAAWMTKQVTHHASPLASLQSEPCALEISVAVEEIQKTVLEAAASPWDGVSEPESPVLAAESELRKPPALPLVQASVEPVDLQKPVLKVVKAVEPKMVELKTGVYTKLGLASTAQVKKLYAQETGKTVDCRLKQTWKNLASFCKGFAEGLSASGRERMRAAGELPLAA